MKKVDAHAHVFEPGLKLASVRRYAPEYKASIEQYIANFESKGLNTGVLIQPSFLGTDNSYMVDAIKAYPNQIYGVAVIDENTVTLEELEELNKHNVIGIRLNLYAKEIPNLRSETWKHVLSYIKKLDWHVELHIDAIVLPDLIDALLEAGVKVVVDHFGKPNPPMEALNDEGFKHLLSVGQTKRVWVKVSGCYRLGGFDAGLEVGKNLMPSLLENFGADRLLWGSDWPHTQYEDKVTYDMAWQGFEKLVPEDKRDAVLSQSFMDLLPKK